MDIVNQRKYRHVLRQLKHLIYFHGKKDFISMYFSYNLPSKYIKITSENEMPLLK